MPLTLIPKTTNGPLRPELHRLLGRFRWIVVLREGSRIGLLLVVLTAILAWLDWRFRLPALVRAFALAGVLTTTALLTYCWLIGPLRRERGSLAMARRVERHYPELNDCLISAVQFLDTPGDQRVGSRLLRKKTIQFAVDFSGDLDFNEAISSRGLKRSVLAFAAVLAGAAWLFNSSPTIWAHALGRVLLPFNAAEWPPSASIDILAPAVLPHRQAAKEWFELQIKIRGVVPDRFSFTVWEDGARPVDQNFPISKVEQESGKPVLTVRLEPERVLRSFRFRVRANDGDTGWQRVEVHQPPFLAPRDGRPSPQIRLIYPAYTDLPALDLPDGNSIIEAVSGTRVLIKAAADRPLTSARFIVKPAQPRLATAAALGLLAARSGLSATAAAALIHDVACDKSVQLSPDGRLIDVDFVPCLSGAYVLRLEDESGFASERSFDVRIDPDRAPTVVLIRPAARREPLTLSADAAFDLTAVVADKKYAIRQVFLEYRTSPGQSFRRIEMFDFPRARAIVAAVTQMMGQWGTSLTRPHSGAGQAGTSETYPTVAARLPKLQDFVLNGRLLLGDFNHPDGSPLKEGDVLTIRVGANDFDDVSTLKAAGYSDEVDLQIVAKSQIDASLNQSLAQIRDELLLLRDLEQEAHLKVLETLKGLDQTSRLTREQIERLQQAEQLQQQIRGKVDAADDGLRARLGRMRQAIADSNLPRTRTTQEVEATAWDLDRLAEDELDPIEKFLQKTHKENDEGPAKSALTQAEHRQAEAEEAIRALLDRLGPWSATGKIRGEAMSILGELRKQLDLLGNLQQSLPPSAVGGKREDLPADLQNRLDRSAVRPERLSDRVRQLFDKMERRLAEGTAELKETTARLEDKEKQAAAAENQANQVPNGSAAEQDLRKRSAALRDEAQNDRDTAAALEEELKTLGRVVEQTNGPALRKLLQDAPGLIRDNKTGDAQDNLRAAANQVEKLVDSLENRDRHDEIDRLRKQRTQEARTRLDELIAGQERLQKKIQAVAQIADPNLRAEELKKLTAEQERLRQETQELIQQLSRTGNERAAQDLRQAARQMEASRQQLEDGRSPDENQDEALDRLDNANDQLERDSQKPDEELVREKLTKSTDLLRGIRDRQAAAVDEEKRLQEKVLKERKWGSAVARNSLPALIDQQDALPKELRGLIEKEFSNDAVFKRMLRQSAEAMEAAVKRLNERKEDVLDQLEGMGAFDPELEARFDRAIRVQQDLALKRLDQLLEALKPDKDMARPPAKTDTPPPKNGDPPASRPASVLPPLAQLKAVRALQADIAERTTEFDKAHPDRDRSKLSPEEIAALDELRKAQLDVAELVQEITLEAMMGEQP